MSKILDPLEDIKALLEGTTGLTGISVLIARQQDLDTEIDMAIAKMGVCICLFPWVLKRERVLPGAPYTADGTIEVVATPLLQPTTGDEARPADEVAELVHWALDGWKPASPGAGLWVDKMAISEITPGTDGDQYLVYQMGTRTRLHLLDQDNNPTNPSL